jgi:predicted enzyme related to lactoylglutathione lyase
VNTLDVASCDEYVRKVETAGGKVALPKMAVPGVGWLAYCIDPEGNTFGIMQSDTQAR